MLTLLIVSALIGQMGPIGRMGWQQKQGEPARTELGGTFGSMLREWGFIAYVQYKDCEHELKGYILGIENDTLYLYTGKMRGKDVYALRLEDIIEVRVDAIDQRSKRDMQSSIGATALLEAISTITHGLFLLVSLPAWILVGITSYALVSSTHEFILIDKGNIDELSRYALFHDGIPKYFKDRVNPHPCFW